MIKYKVKNENGEILFPLLDAYELIDKHFHLIGRHCSDIGQIKIEWSYLGMFVENVTTKEFTIDWVCLSCLGHGTSEVEAETKEAALKEIECHHCTEDEKIILQSDTEKHGIDEFCCWYCGKTNYFYTADGPDDCSKCGHNQEEDTTPDWEDRE